MPAQGSEAVPLWEPYSLLLQSQVIPATHHISWNVLPPLMHGAIL